MMAKLKAGCALWLVTAAVAQANCNPPYTTLLACDIYRSNARVEFCMQGKEAPDGSWKERISYNFTRGLGPAELYFETDQIVASTKYWHLVSLDSQTRTDSLGAVHGNHVYAAFLTGIQDDYASADQIHVYDSVEAYENDQGEVEIQRLYCDPESILMDADRFVPG